MIVATLSGMSYVLASIDDATALLGILERSIPVSKAYECYEDKPGFYRRSNTAGDRIVIINGEIRGDEL